MWTRKAAIILTSGISLILIGMMISNFQLMIIGLTFVSFLAINGWVEGHSDLEINREVSAVNVYKGDDINVILTTSIVRCMFKSECRSSYIHNLLN